MDLEARCGDGRPHHYLTTVTYRRRLRDGFVKTYWIRCYVDGCELDAGPYGREEAEKWANVGRDFPGP